MLVDPKRVQTAFLAALDHLDPAERATVLDRECSADAELRQRVELLLRAHDQPETLLAPNLAPNGLTQTVTVDRPALNLGTEGLGSRIGPYKLLQKLGEGGMGTVYMAEQEKPVRRR